MILLDLCSCAGFSPVVTSRGYSLVVVPRILIAVASLVAAPGLWSTGSIAVVYGLSCSEACGIFLDRGLNSCLLHWQVDSLPRSHQGHPQVLFKGGWSALLLRGSQTLWVSKLPGEHAKTQLAKPHLQNFWLILGWHQRIHISRKLPEML